MADHNGQIDAMSLANYFSYTNRENLPHNLSAALCTPLVTHQVMPMDNAYDQTNGILVNHFEPPFATPNANNTLEDVPFGFSSSCAIPNAHDSDTFVKHGRVKEFSSSISTPPYSTAPHIVFSTSP